MNSSGFTMGLAIQVTNGWLLTLVIVAVLAFHFVLVKNKNLYHAQFLSQRYNGTVALVMAIFWLLLYIVVNLTSILYFSVLSPFMVFQELISGLFIWGLAIFAVIITLGGMKVIGYTDVIQVFFLILGGLVTTYIAVTQVAEHFGTPGFVNGLSLMKETCTRPFSNSLPSR